MMIRLWGIQSIISLVLTISCTVALGLTVHWAYGIGIFIFAIWTSVTGVTWLTKKYPIRDIRYIETELEDDDE